MNLWSDYKGALFDIFPMYKSLRWGYWKSKDTTLVAQLFHNPYIIKSREVEIYSDKSCIYNNIIYPKTGSNLPCFGMDLMGFFDKKVIIVFDFQHPKENYPYKIDGLPKFEGDIRFFEPGNHISENIYVAYCTMAEVNEHLDMFKKYLTKYKEMVDSEKPTGADY